jgi:CRISPR/Cas system CSM-associated protein Csm3 (group 7 of RAMP superfamily)
MNSSPFIFGAITVSTVNPVSFTHHSIDGLPLMTRGIDAEGRHQRTVFVPASQLRGRIRHESAAAELMRGQKVKLEVAYMAALGQDLRPEEDTEVEQVRLAEQQAQRDRQPLLDLFGTWKMASRLMVSHLMPTVNVAAESFSVIRRDLDANRDIMDLLGDEEQDALYERRDRQASASKVENMIKVTQRELMKAKRANKTQDVEEMETKLEELKAQKKAAKGDDDSENTKHLLQIQAIPAGIDLTGKLVVQRARPRDLDILVGAFERISLKPVLGAHLARGFGEVSGKVTFTRDGGEVLVVVGFGGYGPAQVQWTDAGRAYTQEPAAA